MLVITSHVSNCGFCEAIWAGDEGDEGGGTYCSYCTCYERNAAATAVLADVLGAKYSPYLEMKQVGSNNLCAAVYRLGKKAGRDMRVARREDSRF